jgi:hypothetical protein
MSTKIIELNREINTGVADPQTTARLVDLGFRPTAMKSSAPSSRSETLRNQLAPRMPKTGYIQEIGGLLLIFGIATCASQANISGKQTPGSTIDARRRQSRSLGEKIGLCQNINERIQYSHSFLDCTAGSDLVWVDRTADQRAWRDNVSFRSKECSHSREWQREKAPFRATERSHWTSGISEVLLNL